MTRSPDDDEDITYEYDRELGRQEQAEINRRVKWAREQKAAKQRNQT